MITITVNGNTYTINDRFDLSDMRSEHWDDWNAVRTNNAQLLQWELENYLDELDRQDDLQSTGSYGKSSEVMKRVDYAVTTGSRMYLHDVRCRRQNLDDQRINGVRFEHKTSFAQWAYGHSYDECMAKLMRDAAKGKVWSWDPFKNEQCIVMPLKDLVDALAAYSPKGLSVWFSYKANKGQLQIQPVVKSESRRWWIEALVAGVDPAEYLKAKKAERKANRDAE